MKRKFLMVLTLIMVMCSTIGLTACVGNNDNGKTPPHTHEYTILKHNATEHWYECSCGDKIGIENHKGGTATCQEKAICEMCDTLYGDLAEHTYSNEWTITETHHWKVSTCGCDIKYRNEEHYCGNSGFCSVCDKPITSTEGVIYDLSADKTYAEVVDYIGRSPVINIEATFNDVPVKSIYQRVFFEKNITKVVIPNSVEYIGELAFYGCKQLKEVLFGEGSRLTNIGKGAFYECNIQNINIPNGVMSIGDYAFWGCRVLTDVSLGDNLTRIGEWAFSYCYALVNIEIPNSVVSIGQYAFEGCGLLKCTEENNVKYLGNKENPYHILMGVRSKALSTYIINSNTKLIYDNAFKGCSRLKEIVIPDRVISIGWYAFLGCNGLTSVLMGKNVTNIDKYAFDGCSSLVSVYHKGTVDNWSEVSIGEGNSRLTNAVHYYYIENQEDVPTDGGNYWHYDENGNPIIW